QRLQLAFRVHASCRVKHRVGGREIVVTALGEHEYQQRYDVHPTQSSVTLALSRKQIEVQTRDPQRGCQQRQIQLAGKKSVGPALADISGVDMLQKIDRYEVVLNLPDQVWQEDQQGDHNAAPQPFAFQ